MIVTSGQKQTLKKLIAFKVALESVLNKLCRNTNPLQAIESKRRNFYYICIEWMQNSLIKSCAAVVKIFLL